MHITTLSRTPSTQLWILAYSQANRGAIAGHFGRWPCFLFHFFLHSRTYSEQNHDLASLILLTPCKLLQLREADSSSPIDPFFASQKHSEHAWDLLTLSIFFKASPPSLNRVMNLWRKYHPLRERSAHMLLSFLYFVSWPIPHICSFFHGYWTVMRSNEEDLPIAPPNSGAYPAHWRQGSARLTRAPLHLPHARPIWNPTLPGVFQVIQF